MFSKEDKNDDLLWLSIERFFSIMETIAHYFRVKQYVNIQDDRIFHALSESIIIL